MDGLAHGAHAMLLMAGLPVLAYLLAARRYRRRRLRRWSPWRTVAFVTGTALLAFALSPVVADLAGGQARAHMVQHLLVGMLAPLGLVLGAPVTLLLGVLPMSARRPVATVLRSRVLHLVAHPVSAGVLNVGGMYLLFLTPLYALSLREPAVHQLVHVHVLLAGCLFTWSLVGPDPAPRRPGLPVRVAALVLAGAAHGYLGKLLYARAGQLPPDSGHSVTEMQDAAQWMYYGGDVAEVLLAVALFTAWYRSTPRRRGRRAARPRGADPAPAR